MPTRLLRRNQRPIPSSTSARSTLARDLALLVVGAVIGVVPGVATSIVQGKLQREQARFDRSFSVLREALELHNSSSVKLLQIIDDAEGLIADAIEGIETKKRYPPEVAAELRKLSAAYAAERTSYDSKLQVLLTMIYAVHGEELPRLGISRLMDGPYTVHGPAQNPACQQVELSPAPCLERLRTARIEAADLRKEAVNERDRVNRDLKRLATRLVE